METLLKNGLSALGLSTDSVPRLLQFAHMLVEKNRVMNLTAITEPAEIATLHFLDSAALLPLTAWAGKSVADVGTGAGFPGMALKLIEPSLQLTLLDSLNKRIDFLKEACQALGLTDVACVHARAEEFAAAHRESFDIVTSRAVASLPTLCELCLPLVKVGGQFLAMKAVECDDELARSARAIDLLGGTVEGTPDYQIPGSQVCHRVVVIRKDRATPEKYPRTFAKMKKNPL